MAELPRQESNPQSFTQQNSQGLNPLEGQANKPLESNSSPQRNNDFPWLKLFFVPLACYAPAFLLVLVSLWFFRPTNTSQTAPSSVVKAENLPSLQETIDNLDTSPLARDYIKAAISNEVKAQIEQTLPGELENLKTDWKENLSSQIALPILFTIAAIFAAFAVKDVITEILKNEEKRNVKDELSTELRNTLFGEFRDDLITKKIYPKISEEQRKLNKDNEDNFNRIISRLEGIDTKIRWLEYEASDLTTSHLLSLAVSTDREEYILPKIYLSEIALENSLRSISILNQLYNLTGQGDKISLLLEYERRMLDKKISSSNLKKNTCDSIREKLERIIENKESADLDRDIFHIQNALIRDFSGVRLFQLHEILSEILESSESSAVEKEKARELISEVYRVDNYLAKYQRDTEALERSDQATQEEEKKIFEKEMPSFEPKD